NLPQVIHQSYVGDTTSQSCSKRRYAGRKRLNLKSCRSRLNVDIGKFAHVNGAERRRQSFRGLKGLASARRGAGTHEPEDISSFPSSKPSWSKASEVSLSASPTSSRSRGGAPRPSGRSAPSWR